MNATPKRRAAGRITLSNTYGLSLAYARRVWDALDDVSEPATALTIAARLRAPVPSVRRALHELELSGFVRSYEEHRWTGKGKRRRSLHPLFVAHVRP